MKTKIGCVISGLMLCLLFSSVNAQIITQIIDGSGDGAGNELLTPQSLAVDDNGNVFVGGLGDNFFKIRRME